MAKKKSADTKNKKQEPEKNNQDPQHTQQAHREADKDIENDPDLSPRPERGDDLDEGELARLEGED